MELAYGRGRIVLYGFKPQFRGQSHATYKYLFNELYAFDHPSLPSETTPAVKGETTSPQSDPTKDHKSADITDDETEE